jgi:hypothetical protein
VEARKVDQIEMHTSQAPRSTHGDRLNVRAEFNHVTIASREEHLTNNIRVDDVYGESRFRTEACSHSHKRVHARHPERQPWTRIRPQYNFAGLPVHLAANHQVHLIGFQLNIRHG